MALAEKLFFYNMVAGDVVIGGLFVRRGLGIVLYMNMQKLCLAFCLGISLLLTGAAVAQEGAILRQNQSTTNNVENKFTNFKDGVRNMVTPVQQRLENISTCHKEKRFWSGTDCVAPTLRAVNPTVLTSVKTSDYFVTRTTGGRCCNRDFLNSCVRRSVATTYACKTQPGIHYEYNPETNTLEIIQVNCDPHTEEVC